MCFAEAACEEVAGFFESGDAAAEAREGELLVWGGVEFFTDLVAEGGEAVDLLFEGFFGGAEGDGVQVEAIGDGVACGLERGGWV